MDNDTNDLDVKLEQASSETKPPKPGDVYTDLPEISQGKHGVARAPFINSRDSDDRHPDKSLALPRVGSGTSKSGNDLSASEDEGLALQLSDIPEGRSSETSRDLRSVGAHFTEGPSRLQDIDFESDADECLESLDLKIMTARIESAETKGEIQREALALKRFNEQTHPHLIRLLATYSHRGRFHMVFPWADGNLKDLWTLFPEQRFHSSDGPQSIRWLSKQIIGLANALAIIHFGESKSDIHEQEMHDTEQPYGRHGNLKPENILWFQRDAENSNDQTSRDLVISDYGLAGFRSSHSWSDVEEIDASYVPATYKAPEIEVKNDISQSYDLWCLGCILLEFVGWFLQGWKALEDFSKRRARDLEGAILSPGSIFPEDTFFKLARSQNQIVAKPKSSVTEEFAKLRALPSCSSYLLDLLEIVQVEMLIVEPKQRIKVDALIKKLSILDRQCRQNESYCLNQIGPIQEISADQSELWEAVGINMQGTDVIEAMSEVFQRTDNNQQIPGRHDDENNGNVQNDSDVDVNESKLMRKEPTLQSTKDDRTLVPESSNRITLVDVGSTDSLHHVLDELEPFSSDDDDISSQASYETTQEGKTGKVLIQNFLLEEPEFSGLCKEAALQLNRQQFEENMRRLLKRFYKSLLMEAEATAEKKIADLLRSRLGRSRISRKMADHFEPQQEETSQRIKLDQNIPREEKFRTENWLAGISEEFEEMKMIADPGIGISENEEQVESDLFLAEEKDSGEYYPHISKLKDFLQGTESLRLLIRDGALTLLPTEIRQVLRSIPAEHISVSVEQDDSTLNRVKGWIENASQARWNWWPLESRRRDLRKGEARMFWQCTCGSRHWCELSLKQHEFVGRVLKLPDEAVKSSSWCASKTNKTSFIESLYETVFWLKRCAPRETSNSSAAQRYTSSRGVSSTPGESQSTTIPMRDQSSIAPASTPSATQLAQTGQPLQPAGSAGIPSVQFHVLFGVQSSQLTLTPDQIQIRETSNDSTLFTGLKRCYKTHRGRLRLWFSIWHLETCEVVKFSRLAPTRMVHEHSELPTDNAYVYRPRSGDSNAKNPPISRQLFQVLFHSCQSPCPFRFYHNCMVFPDGSRLLEKIPKRKDCFLKDTNCPSIWGLEPTFEISGFHVFIYHCVMVAAPFTFFGWRLKVHPNDLQNAAVPLGIVIPLVSLFWSVTGIIPPHTRRRR